MTSVYDTHSIQHGSSGYSIIKKSYTFKYHVFIKSWKGISVTTRVYRNNLN